MTTPVLKDSGEKLKLREKGHRNWGIENGINTSPKEKLFCWYFLLLLTLGKLCSFMTKATIRKVHTIVRERKGKRRAERRYLPLHTLWQDCCCCCFFNPLNTDDCKLSFECRLPSESCLVSKLHPLFHVWEEMTKEDFGKLSGDRLKLSFKKVMLCC